jgi:transcriptional regulator with XRE-family HTH domain
VTSSRRKASKAPTRTPKTSLAARRALGELLNDAITAAGVSARSVARRIDVDRSYFWRVLRGEKTLTREKLLAVADLLGLQRRAVLQAAGERGSAGVATELADVLPRRATSQREIQVITDPRFIDSGLFYWLMNSQPFEPLGIRCRPVSASWNTVAQEVATRESAFGFVNRREAVAHPQHLLVWADLTLYTGYALLVRRAAFATQPTFTTDSAEVARQLERLAHPEAGPITINCIGADTERQFTTNPFLKGSLKNFEFKRYSNAELALRDFLAGSGHGFVGGLPQRLFATSSRPDYCIELVTFDNNPLLFAVNSLVCNRSMAEHDRPILHAATALWFETIVRIKRDSAYREAVIAEMSDFLKAELGTEPALCRLERATIERVFLQDSYEIFPETSADFVSALRRIFEGTQTALGQLATKRNRHVTPDEVLEYVRDTLGAPTVAAV